MQGRMRTASWVWGSAITIAALVFVACGGGSKSSSPSTAAPASTTTAPPEDAELTADDFPNINDMTKVGVHFIANFNGHLDEAIAVSKNPDGGRYPVGTLIQLVPQEAMVKRHAGFSPVTNDWEFFFLDVSDKGTKIISRGGDEVENRFGGSCAACHGFAEQKFDMVCNGIEHGCAPLPVGRDIFAFLQRTDPRPRKQ
jgi:hypothetical protein